MEPTEAQLKARQTAATEDTFNRANAVLSGAGMTPIASSTPTISVDALQNPQQPIKLPQTQPTPAMSYDYTELLNQAKALSTPDSGLASEQARAQATYEALLGQGGRAEFRAQAEEASGLKEQRQRIQNLSTQLAGLNAQAQNVQGQVVDKFGASDALQGFVDARTQGITRQINRQQNIVAAQLAAEQGNYELAQQAIDRSIQDEFADRQDRLTATKANLDAIKERVAAGTLTLSDAFNAKIAEQDKKIAADQKRIDEEKQTRKDISQIMLTARQYGADDATVNKIMSAGTLDEAIALAGSSLQDPRVQLELQNLRLANNLKSLEIQAKNQELATSNGTIIPSLSDYAPSGAGTPKDSIVSAITKMKLTEGQGNAVSFAMRMMEADASMNRQVDSSYNPTTVASAVGRTVRSDNSRVFNRDLENFIRAQLRKESGAQIAPTEMEGGTKIYSPQGILTDDKDIEQTGATRKQAIDSMITQAGPAGAALKEYASYLESGGLLPQEEYELSQRVQSATPKELDTTDIWK